MPYSLGVIGLLVGLIQWYQKQIEPDVRLEIGTILTNRVKSLLNTLASEYIDVVNKKKEKGGNAIELRLKENIEIQGVKNEVLALAAKLKDSQKIQKRMRRLHWIQKKLIWFIALAITSEALVLCKTNLHPLGILSKYSSGNWLLTLSQISNYLIPINTVITIGSLILLFFYAVNLFSIYTFKAIE